MSYVATSALNAAHHAAMKRGAIPYFSFRSSHQFPGSPRPGLVKKLSTYHITNRKVAEENTKEVLSLSALAFGTVAAVSVSMILSSVTYGNPIANLPSQASSTMGKTISAIHESKLVGGGGGGSGGGSGGGGDINRAVTPQHEESCEREKVNGKSKPYEVSIQALQGYRDNMEDEFFVADNGRFAAVFDGHGGPTVSEILKRRLYNDFREHLKSMEWERGNDIDTSKNIPSIGSHNSALRNALKQIDIDILKDKDLRYQGSTAVMLLQHESKDGFRTLISANIGDSRAILSKRGNAIHLTRDHKPNDVVEMTRIKSMGGRVVWDSECKVHRVRNLSLSRAVGDKYAKPIVSAEPEIRQFPLEKDADEFVVLASDGLWDVMTSQEVVDFVHDQNISSPIRRKQIADKLAREALRRRSEDNVCVLVVWLNTSD